MFVVYCTECGQALNAQISKEEAENPEVYWLVAVEVGTENVVFGMRSLRPLMSFHVGETFTGKNSDKDFPSNNEGVPYKIVGVQHELDGDSECSSHRVVLHLERIKL